MILLIAVSRSAFLVCRPIEIRIEFSDRPVSKPMAFNTCEGLTSPLVQAEPVDMKIFGCNLLIKAFASMFGSVILRLPGWRFSNEPLSNALG